MSTTASSKNTQSWTLRQLSARVGQALAVDYSGPANRQAKAVPNERTLRYYMTIGLLDRPHSWRGRTALFGEHHLLQVAAIKRLQEQGFSLESIQQKLFGLSGNKLQGIARLPQSTIGDAQVVSEENSDPKRQTEDTVTQKNTPFWRAGDRDRRPLAQPVTEPPQPTPSELQTLQLDPQIALVWFGLSCDPQERQALQQAALPLQQFLKSRGLCPTGKDVQNKGETK